MSAAMPYLHLFAAFLVQQPSPSPEAPVALRRVVAALAEAARENGKLPAKDRLDGDALADLYVRRACAAGPDGRSVVLGLAYALDGTSTLANNPIFGEPFKGLEDPEERKARASAMGTPTLRGRGDWLHHFVVSAGIALLADEASAESAGIQKELADAGAKARGRGTGFSFSDLLADFAGIAFAEWMTGEQGDKARERCARSFAGADFLPDPAGLPEGLTLLQFEEAWGGAKGPKFRTECSRLKMKVQAGKGYQ